jgi:hypothetical protein
MPWILTGLFVLIKTRRGRKLLFGVGVAAFELVQSERARTLYGKALAGVKSRMPVRES